MPDNPATKSKIAFLEDDETQYPWRDLMQEAIANIETLELDGLA